MSVSAYDEKLFDAACEDIIEKERAKNGIGTLQEKTMHAVLKRFYEPNHTHQEIRINGYVADIFRDNEIIEIQTGSFNAMRKKLDTFLEEYPVTIVYPIIHTKCCTGSMKVPGRSARKENHQKQEGLLMHFMNCTRSNPIWQIQIYRSV